MTMNLILNITANGTEHEVICEEWYLDEFEDADGFPLSVLEQLQAAIAKEIGTQQYTIDNFADEYERVSLETVAEFLQGYFSDGEPWAAFVAIHGMRYMDKRAFDNSFEGEYDDLYDFVDSVLSCYEIPRFLEGYIDRGKLLDDLMISDYTSHEFDYSNTIYVFRNC